jgi:hypothetical protein
MNTLTQMAVQAQMIGNDIETWMNRRQEADRERGSHTTDIILWALAIIVVVGIAVAFLTGYVQKIGNQLLNS